MISRIHNFLRGYTYRLIKHVYKVIFWWVVIHTFWDSHAEFWWNRIISKKIHIIVHTLWPKLLYSVWRDWLDLLDISKPEYWVKNWDIVCFCFWEIDCRCHIHKHREKWYKKVINAMVDKYMETISKNVSTFWDIKVCIYNVVPPANSEWKYNDPNYPFLGSNKERLQYVTYMNDRLKAVAKSSGYIYVDVFDQYADQINLLNDKYSDGHVHIVNPKFLRKFLELNVT